MNIKAYLTAGNCIFTLYSKKLDQHYTYKINVDKKRDDRYFAKVLFGSNNETDYRYIGLFYKDNLSLRTSTAAHLPHTTPQFVMLQYFLKIVYGDFLWPDTCEFYPSGRCCRCGRRLTTPDSVETGIGPECRKYIRRWENDRTEQDL